MTWIRASWLEYDFIHSSYKNKKVGEITSERVSRIASPKVQTHTRVGHLVQRLPQTLQSRVHLNGSVRVEDSVVVGVAVGHLHVVTTSSLRASRY